MTPVAGPHRPPGLVLGTGITALGVVRSLGRAGIPLYGLSTPRGPAASSRWYRRPPHGAYLLSPAGLMDYLQALPLEKGVLFPSSDADVLAVARLPRHLKARFPCSLSTAPALDHVLDKGKLLRVLEARGVPHPKTMLVHGPDDDITHAYIDPDRAFIKPRESQEFIRRFGTKAIRPTGPDDLRAKVEWMTGNGLDIMIQEYIPGPPVNHYFVDGFIDAHGVVRARLCHRRLRMFPSEFGDSTAMTTVAPDALAPAVERVEEVLGFLAYRGMYSAEFKLDDRDGVLRLLEINARPWWYLEFAARCGLDVVLMAYRDALGLPVADAFSAKEGRHMVHLSNDAAAWRALRGSGEARRIDHLRSLVRSDWAMFARDDPLPAITDMGGFMLQAFKRRLGARRRSGGAPPPTIAAFG